MPDCGEMTIFPLTVLNSCNTVTALIFSLICMIALQPVKSIGIFCDVFRNMRIRQSAPTRIVGRLKREAVKLLKSTI